MKDVGWLPCIQTVLMTFVVFVAVSLTLGHGPPPLFSSDGHLPVRIFHRASLAFPSKLSVLYREAGREVFIRNIVTRTQVFEYSARTRL